MINLNLNLLQYKEKLVTKTNQGNLTVWDPIRKYYLVFTPEESVRQLLLHHLILEMRGVVNRISIEKEIKVNFMKKRFDLLVYDSDFKPFMLVECKAPHIGITQSVFDQISWYNVALQAPYLLVTNGIKSYCAKIDFEEKTYSFSDKLPFNDQIL